MSAPTLAPVLCFWGPPYHGWDALSSGLGLLSSHREPPRSSSVPSVARVNCSGSWNGTRRRRPIRPDYPSPTLGMGYPSTRPSSQTPARPDKTLHAGFAPRCTWEQYTQERWEISFQRAAQLISAYEIQAQLRSTLVEDSSTNSRALPTRETHIRPLAALPDAKQRRHKPGLMWTASNLTKPETVSCHIRPAPNRPARTPQKSTESCETGTLTKSHVRNLKESA